MDNTSVQPCVPYLYVDLLFEEFLQFQGTGLETHSAVSGQLAGMQWNEDTPRGVLLDCESSDGVHNVRVIEHDTHHGRIPQGLSALNTILDFGTTFDTNNLRYYQSILLIYVSCLQF